MAYTTLITVPELQMLMTGGGPLAVFDCSADLADRARGPALFRSGHIAGARYASLEDDLSAHAPGAAQASGGRHPLPAREDFAQWLGRAGVTHDTQVVVYDRNGNNFCGRLWWMLKWVGHDAVAVLDGGLAAWQAAGGAVEAGDAPAHAPTSFRLGEPLRRLLTGDDVVRRLGEPGQTLVDARATPRYRGEVEPLDPVAGHIPGALNRPFTQNFDADGRFKPSAQLRAEFTQLLAGRAPDSVVHQCGSGVSAVPNLLAMEIAGLGPTALYAGSWSEWSRDPSRPVAQG